jgi:hypothetical protein
MTNKLRNYSALTLAALAAVSSAQAIDAGGIAIHGAVSATAAYSGDYDYYGDTSDSLDLDVKEITLNGAYRFDSGLRIAAQLYAYDLAGYKDLTLDFATVDYSFNEMIGLRVGRNKLPQGLYGEVQDLDQIRVFASLPLNFYPRAARPLSAGYNGAGLYGTLGLAKAGSVDYQIFFGWVDNIDGDAPYVRGNNGLLQIDGIDIDQAMGGSLVWNAPVEGLKFGYTYNLFPDIKSNGHLQTTGGMLASGYSGNEAAGIDFLYGAGTWDYSGMFAGTPNTATVDASVQILSVEYTHDKWIGAAEYKKSKNEGVTSVPAFGISNQVTLSEEEHWYAQVTYQATDKFGAGVYYAHSDFDPKNTDARDDKYTTVKDLAVGASYALTSNWLIKVEGHALDGLAKLNLAGDVNRNTPDSSWNYFVVKTTFSF